MKLIILISFLALSTVHAAEYNCRVSAFRLQMHTDSDLTDLTIRDAQSGEYFYNGIVNEIIDRDGRIDLIFEPHSHKLLKLQFKSEDFKKEADTLFGFAQGWTGGGFVNDSMRCFKK